MNFIFWCHLSCYGWAIQWKELKLYILWIEGISSCLLKLFMSYRSYWLEGKQNKASKPSYTTTIVPDHKTTVHSDCGWNSYFGFNFLLFQRKHSQTLLHFLGKDQNVFHTFIHNKFPLRRVPAVSLFVSVISCLEVFFQFAPQKKNYLECIVGIILLCESSNYMKLKFYFF